MSEPRGRAQSKRLMLFYVALSVVVASAPLAAFALVSDRSEVRYFGQYSAHHRAIFDEKGPVDVAYGGSSRTRRGMFVPFLKESLAPYFGGREPVIYNLAMAGNGTDAQIRILIELLEHRDVRYLFVQLYQMRDNKFPTHRNLRKFGKLEDVLGGPMQGHSWFEIANHRVQMMYLRISEMLDNCLATPSTCISAPKSSAGPWSEPRTVDVARQRRFLQARDRRRNGEYFRYEPRGWDFENGPDSRTTYYLDQLLDLARAKGTTVVFMDLAKFEWDSLAEGFPERIKGRFGVDYVYLDKDQLREHGKDGYGDYGHVNLRGEPRFREMIVEYFKAKAADASDGAATSQSSRGSQ